MASRRPCRPLSPAPPSTNSPSSAWARRPAGSRRSPSCSSSSRPTAAWRSCSSSTSIRRTRASSARRWPGRRRCRSSQAEDGDARRAEPRLRDPAERRHRDPQAVAHARRRATRRRAAPHLPIDFFLRSLAAERGSHAIGVVLSGNGVRRHRGAARHQGRGRHHLRAGPRVGEVRRHAAQRDRRRRRRLRAAASRSSPQRARAPRAAIPTSRPARRPRRPSDDARRSRKIFALVRSAVGRRLQRVQGAHLRAAAGAPDGAAPGATSLPDYLALLRADPDEVRALYEDMLIHVTSFFRDPEVFEALKAHVFPEILKHKADGRAHSRSGSPAARPAKRSTRSRSRCSSSSATSASHPIQIFGSDVSERRSRRRAPASTPTARCAT